MDMHSQLQSALVCQQQGQWQAAEKIYLQILAAAPGQTEALIQLSRLYAQRGDSAQAIRLLRQALESRPEQAELHFQLGVLLHRQQQLPEALSCFETVIRLQPTAAEAYNELGIVRHKLGQLEKAVEAYQLALKLRPEYGDVRNNLGNAFQDLNRLEQALEQYAQVLRHNPGHASAYTNQGNTYKKMGQFQLALESFRQSVRLNPQNPHVYNNLGNCLSALGQYPEALQYCQTALRLMPDNAEFYINLGVILEMQGQTSQAIGYYCRALELNPASARAYNDLGSAYRAQGKLEQAMACYERALELQPGYRIAHRNVLLTLNYLPHLPPEAVFRKHRAWGIEIEQKYPQTYLHRPDGTDRRLRIGYVSSVFRHHAVCFYLEPVLLHHDRQAFELVCYSDLYRPDAMTEHLQGLVDGWREIHTVDTRTVADRIHRDRIDILVDLDGHTGHSRLEVFALKPAPVQVSYLGYPNTTGLSAIDYRLTDARADPPGLNDAHYTERLFRLPQNFSCYAAPPEVPELSGLPALTAGVVTFGSFNLLTKLTPEVLALWARVLLAVPGARLVLKSKPLNDSQLVRELEAHFARLGVEASRLSLLGFASGFANHLAAYSKVDIGLDPFP
ncbi:MAG TPA: tetratricopeptide repeat protein, partial [Candidatus Obscuribacterales bacterium]